MEISLILTVAAPKIRDEVLQGLGKTNPEFADMVRKSLFMFDDIAERISAKDIPQFIKSINQDDVVKALAHAQADNSSATVDFIVSNLSKRMGEALVEEIQSLPMLDAEEGERAINQLISSLQAMIAKGDIKLL